MNPEISVIICTYNRGQLLKKTLLSFNGMRSAIDFEIIVVDNNSKDDTKNVVDECKLMLELEDISVKYILEKNQGLSIARNTGLKHASADIVAFLDDDAIPSSTWLSSIKHTFINYPYISAIGGIVEPIFETEKPEWLSGKLEHLYTIINLGESMRKYPKRFYPVGANMAFRKSVFDEVKFPEHLGRQGTTLLSGEETWVFSQLIKKGYQVYYVPQMKIKHFISKERLSEDWILKRYYFEGRSKAYFATTLPKKMVLITESLIKIIYLFGEGLFVREKSKKLLNQCRKKSQFGVLKELLDFKRV